MSVTSKVSMAIGREELAWAKTLAKRQGKSLSAIVTESLAERRRLEALSDVIEWMGEDQAPLSTEELEKARNALGRLGQPQKKKTTRQTPRRRR